MKKFTLNPSCPLRFSAHNMFNYKCSHFAMYAFLVICIMSCVSYKLGNKVYVEEYDYVLRIHIAKNCQNISKAHPVKYLDTKELRTNKFYSFCTECVSDDDADKLNSVMQENDVRDSALYAKRISELYKMLRRDGYDDLGTEQEFRNKLQNQDKRIILYNALVRDNYDVGDFKQFEKEYGFESLQ